MCVQWVGILTWFSEGLYERSDQCTAAGLTYTLTRLSGVKEAISKHLLVQDDSAQSEGGEGGWSECYVQEIRWEKDQQNTFLWGEFGVHNQHSI